MSDVVEMKPRVKPRLVTIGIDPGKLTGLAIAVAGEIVSVETTYFWGCISKIHTFYKPEEVRVIRIEISTKSHVWRKLGSPQRASALGGSVAKVRREGELLADGLRLYGYNVEEVEPQGNKWVGTKSPGSRLTYFQQITGYTGVTSEHGRDAAMLIVETNHKKPKAK